MEHGPDGEWTDVWDIPISRTGTPSRDFNPTLLGLAKLGYEKRRGNSQTTCGTFYVAASPA